MCIVAQKAVFTFHNVSINSTNTPIIATTERIFTFHNVSINSWRSDSDEDDGIHLHSTMFLLIPFLMDRGLVRQHDLHSTMFLLIHKSTIGRYTEH